jgi:hypothetical protein
MECPLPALEAEGGSSIRLKLPRFAGNAGAAPSGWLVGSFNTGGASGLHIPVLEEACPTLKA